MTAVSEDQSASVPQVQQSVNHKTVLKEELDRLENSLASLKDVPGLEDCKSQLESKIKEQKRAITKANPPDAQLESCLKALERAHARRASAASALAAAQKVIEDEDLNIANLSKVAFVCRRAANDTNYNASILEIFSEH